MIDHHGGDGDDGGDEDFVGGLVNCVSLSSLSYVMMQVDLVSKICISCRFG